MVFARNHFDLTAPITDAGRPKVGLLNEDYHMDYDEEFKMDYLKSLYVTNKIREDQKATLLDSLRKEEE